MINVLLVDDHELVRTGIEFMLNSVDDITVVAVAECGEQALLFARQMSPDIVLMDVNMPGMGGLEACRRILQIHPNIKVIALSAYDKSFVSEQLLKLGAMGFISKNSSLDEMVAAIRSVMAGKLYFPETSPDKETRTSSHCPFSQLSKREKQVVCLILQGRGIQEMAEILALSDKTVNTYRYRLYEKLNAKNDVELTRLAVKYNYADSELELNELNLKKTGGQF